MPGIDSRDDTDVHRMDRNGGWIENRANYDCMKAFWVHVVCTLADYLAAYINTNGANVHCLPIRISCVIIPLDYVSRWHMADSEFVCGRVMPQPRIAAR
jgi:hypothetical protein